MIDTLPWQFDPHKIVDNFAIFYGKDMALAISLARSIESKCESEDFIMNNTSILFMNSLFDADLPIRVMGSAKLAQNLLHLYEEQEFTSQCLLITEGNPRKIVGVSYVKCEPLNARSRPWFIKFHCKRLGFKIPDTISWINNLDDLYFANTLQKLGASYEQVYLKNNKSFDIWSQIRISQFRNEHHIANIYKHFELWARHNAPNDECLDIFFSKLVKEVEEFKNETTKRNA